MPKEPIDAAALEAIGSFAARALVFLVPGREKERPAWVASGTPIRTPGGRTAILTAAHNVESARREPLRLGYYQCRDRLEDVVAAFATHPDATIDVAAVAVKREPAAAISDHVLSISAIAVDDEVRSRSDALLLAGFPARLTQEAWTERLEALPLLSLGFISVTYGTGLQDPPTDEHGRLRVEWGKMDVPDGPPVAMPDPKGISGGALWRFRNAGPGVWSPGDRGQIIGVPVAWCEHTSTEYVEPVSKWREWLLRTLELFDGLP